MLDNPLGKKISYSKYYDKNLLYPIGRSDNRKINNIDSELFSGIDLWNCYEFTFLNLLGKPLTYTLQIDYDCQSLYMVESKSLKLYLNSFAMTPLNNIVEAINIISKDLKEVLKTDVFVSYKNWFDTLEFTKIDKKYLLDFIDIEVSDYNLNQDILKTTQLTSKRDVVRYSNLFRSNCPITGQPDYATILLKYRSDTIIDDTSLLKYIISFRNHWDYHENCCEKIFMDIHSLIKPDSLLVGTFFTRRGGIDINPIRYSGVKFDKKYKNFHFWRQ